MKKVFIGITLLAIVIAISTKIQPNIIVKLHYNYLLKKLPKQIGKGRTLSKERAQRPWDPPKKRGPIQRFFYTRKSKKLYNNWLTLTNKIQNNYNQLRHYEKLFPKLKGGVQKIHAKYRQEIGSIFRLIHSTKR